MDLNTFIITAFCLRGRLAPRKAPAPAGPSKPKLSDAEVLAIEIVAAPPGSS
jgi:hypothetical protein